MPTEITQLIMFQVNVCALIIQSVIATDIKVQQKVKCDILGRV